MDEPSIGLAKDVIETIRSASKKLGGFARRQFQAEVAWAPLAFLRPVLLGFSRVTA